MVPHQNLQHRVDLVLNAAKAVVGALPDGEVAKRISQVRQGIETVPQRHLGQLVKIAAEQLRGIEPFGIEKIEVIHLLQVVERAQHEIELTGGKDVAGRIQILCRLPQLHPRINAQAAAEDRSGLFRLEKRTADRTIVFLLIISIAFAVIGHGDRAQPQPGGAFTHHDGRIAAVARAVAVHMAVRDVTIPDDFPSVPGF